MPDSPRGRLLRTLRVPGEPAPPPGDPARTRTFRASPRFLRYRTLVWGVKQLGAFSALVIGYLMLNVVRVRTGLPIDVVGLIELLAWVGFIAQLPFSYAVLRLDFDMRWYMLSDRSLRIREGVLTVSEKTMTFANIQKIAIAQNPLQRIFGIADVTVRSAGGGASVGSQHRPQRQARSMHEAAFEGVEDANAIRDLIRDRIRRYHGAGLGDPDETRKFHDVGPDDPDRTSSLHGVGPGDPEQTRTAHDGSGAPTTAAARALLHEARLLRAELQR
jgi:membrane protein YdbS with pleckstrin-like domain